MNNEKLLLGERIKQLRKQKHFTQEKLSELVNRTKNHISKIEQGTANPPLDLIISIAQALDVTLKELFNFEYDTPIKNINVKEELKSIINKTTEKHLKTLLKIHKSLDSD